MNSPLLIATDQATDGPTGIVVGRYHISSGAETLLTETLSGPQELIHYFYMLKELYHPLAVAREAGYFSKKSPEAGLNTEQSGGWVEILAMIMWPGIIYRSYKAIDWNGRDGWRDSVFSDIPPAERKRMTADDWKKTVLLWTRDDPLIKDHHQGEAKGILSKLGEVLVGEGVITCE